MSQWQTAGAKLEAVLKERHLGKRTFAKMLADDSGKTVENERRGVSRRLKGQTFQKETALRYARVLGLPDDYFNVGKPLPTRTEVDRLVEQAEALARQIADLQRRLDLAEEA